MTGTSRLFAGVASTLLVLVATLTAPAPALADPPEPGAFLVFPRFQADDDFDSALRVLTFGATSAVDVTVLFVCQGDGGACDSLATTVTLEPGELRSIDVATLNLPCSQGYAVAFPVDESGDPVGADVLVGSYEITFKGKGKRWESDVALSFPASRIGSINQERVVTFVGSEPGQRLMSDFRALSVPNRRGVRQEGSYVNLLDLSVQAGASNGQTTATLDWWTDDGDTSFSVTVGFTCFGRFRVDDISVNLLEENHGSPVGWLRVRARGDSVLAGAVSEFGKGSATIRNMFDATD